jgi:hypothetical protein
MSEKYRESGIVEANRGIERLASRDLRKVDSREAAQLRKVD